jgi:membrane protein insertase Oxa1/YidC/SpoIIIJ
MTKFNPTTAQQQEGSNQAGGNFMKYFFPLFSVYICLTSNAAFALYWVVSNIIATTSTIAINAYFDRKDALATEAKER